MKPATASSPYILANPTAGSSRLFQCVLCNVRSATDTYLHRHYCCCCCSHINSPKSSPWSQDRYRSRESNLGCTKPTDVSCLKKKKTGPSSSDRLKVLFRFFFGLFTLYVLLRVRLYICTVTPPAPSPRPSTTRIANPYIYAT